jgi:hypothetical protein
MKILAVGDPHFMFDYPYANRIPDRRRAERALVLSTIHRESKDCDAVVLMGDNLDKRHNHSSAIKEFVEFLHGFGDKRIHIISGNHETFEGNKTALDFLIGINPWWSVYTPAGFEAGVSHFVTPNYQIGLIPYMTNSSLGASSKEEARDKLMLAIEKYKYDVLFVHHMVSGTTGFEGANEIVLPRERLEAVATLVVAGHIHEEAVKGRTILTGNIFTHDVGQTERSILKIDTEDDTYSRIALPVRPIYKLFNPTIEALDALPANSIIRTILTDKGQDVEAIKESLKRFDASLFVEQYPNERERLHVDKGQTLDLSIPALIDMYAKAKKKNPERLKKAFVLVNES